MFTRATGLIIVPLWLVAMGWLTAHDIVPRWTAQEPPPSRPKDWTQQNGAKAQYAITLADRPIGSIWTSYLIDKDAIRRDDLVWIESFPLDLAPLRINVSSILTASGILDEFKVVLESNAAAGTTTLRGERFHSDFSFALEQSGTIQTFKIPLAEGELFSSSVNPFGELSDLSVGRSWRMQVFNPVTVLTGMGDRFIPMLVKVTGEERIKKGGWEGNCWVVESAAAKAWIDAQGIARLQEILLPVVGVLRIMRESEFDERARIAARQYRFQSG